MPSKFKCGLQFDKKNLRSTILSIIQFPSPYYSISGKQDNSDFDGYDIWESINNKKEFLRDEIIYNLDIADQSPNFQFAVRLKNWKLFWGQEGKLNVNSKPKSFLKLFNLERDPYEKRNLAELKVDKVQKIKKLIYSRVKDMKPSFHPNRFNLAFPRYNDGIIQSGWCQSNWDTILWKYQTQWDKILKNLEGAQENNYDLVYDYDYNYD